MINFLLPKIKQITKVMLQINILITLNLNIKLSDFSLLTKVNENENLKIPGGTPGYVSREYYDKQKISKVDLQKQDYFSLGSTLFYLKYGENMLDYDEDNITRKKGQYLKKFIGINGLIEIQI